MSGSPPTGVPWLVLQLYAPHSVSCPAFSPIVSCFTTTRAVPRSPPRLFQDTHTPQIKRCHRPAQGAWDACPGKCLFHHLMFQPPRSARLRHTCIPARSGVRSTSSSLVCTAVSFRVQKHDASALPTLRSSDANRQGSAKPCFWPRYDDGVGVEGPLPIRTRS